MPPKIPPITPRIPIQNASLLYIPEDAVAGWQERIETGVPWTILEEACRYHRSLQHKEMPKRTFREALRIKLSKTILGGCFNKKSGLSLSDQFELNIPISLWDAEKFSNTEGTICFNNTNSLTDKLDKMLKKAVDNGDCRVLMKELKKTLILRLIYSKLTDLDKSLLDFHNLTFLNLSGNYLKTLDPQFIPKKIRGIELQANHISAVDGFASKFPKSLIYLGLGLNLINNESAHTLQKLPYNLVVLDLGDNDIYNLAEVIDALKNLANLKSLVLAGNPCSMCLAYITYTLQKMPRLEWLDNREIAATDRPLDNHECVPDDFLFTYFNFSIIRITFTPPPPKLEKSGTPLFFIELELPLLDSFRRNFLMYRQVDALTEYLPPPEDEEWENVAGAGGSTSRTTGYPLTARTDSETHFGEEEEEAIVELDVYEGLAPVDSRVIYNFTHFESNRVQWNKLMVFQTPTLRIFCPDLKAVRDTFRTEITLRFICSYSSAQKKPPSAKSTTRMASGELRVVLATVKCKLGQVDWSQPQQQFYWDETMKTDNAMLWPDNDLWTIPLPSSLSGRSPGKEDSKSQAAEKAAKAQAAATASKAQAAAAATRSQTTTTTVKAPLPEAFSLQFAFGIETNRPSSPTK